MDELISRQKTVDLVKDVCDAIISTCKCHYDHELEDEVFDDIKEVNAILKCNKEIRIALRNLEGEPEKAGHWIEIGESIHAYKCSECGRLLVNITDGKNHVYEHYPYCHCGAHMIEVEHD